MEIKLNGARNSVDVPDHLAKRLARLGLVENAEAISAIEDQTGNGADQFTPASMQMRKQELVELAEARGVAIETDDNKADIVAKINAHVEASAVQVVVQGEDGEIVYDETHDLPAGGDDADGHLQEAGSDASSEGEEADAEAG